MGYATPTSKKATALDYAQIDHYNRSLEDSSIAPLDTSASNLYNFSKQKLGDRSYRLRLGTPTQNNTIMDNSMEKPKPISKMELLTGDKFENKVMFEENQLTSRPSYNPAESMISNSPDFDVPVDNQTPEQDKLGGLITSGIA